MRTPIPRAWRIPFLLIGLSLVPFAATANRLNWIMSGGAKPDSALDRFAGDWSMLAVHTLIGSLFLILAAVQFSPELRARHRSWHRGAGKIAILAGIVAGLCGVWLVVAYPSGDLATPVMNGVRFSFGLALAGSVVLAYRAVRRGDIVAHRAWIIRAFALGIAGATQALSIGLWVAAAGPLTPESATVLITFGFALNIVLGEWRIRVPRRNPFTTVSTE